MPQVSGLNDYRLQQHASADVDPTLPDILNSQASQHMIKQEPQQGVLQTGTGAQARLEAAWADTAKAVVSKVSRLGQIMAAQSQCKRCITYTNPASKDMA